MVFTPVPYPTDQQLAAIVTAVRNKFIRRVRKISGLSREAAENSLSWKNSPAISAGARRIGERVFNTRCLDRLLGYCSRPAISQKRLVYSEQVNTVLYRTKPKAGKSEMLIMPPVEFLRRWTLLMPPPNKNLVHYYGALAPRSPLRPLLVAKAEKEADQATSLYEHTCGPPDEDCRLDPRPA